MPLRKDTMVCKHRALEFGLEELKVEPHGFLSIRLNIKLDCKGMCNK